MPTRDALRDLQERLAQRLHAVHDPALQASWLAVHAAPPDDDALPCGGRLLLPLAQAGEIFPFVQPHPVPHTRPWFLGVAHLRGGLWGAVDLAGFLADFPAGGNAPARAGLPREGVKVGVTAGANGGANGGGMAQARLVTLHASLGAGAALRIDRLVGLRGADAWCDTSDPHAEAPGACADAPAFFGPRYTDADGRTWQSLDLQALAREPRFLQPAWTPAPASSPIHDAPRTSPCPSPPSSRS